MDDELPEICTLHLCDLVEGIVPIFRGFFGTSPNYGRAWREQFRYSRSWSAGGCSLSPGRPALEAILYCKVCREAELAWLASQIAENPDESSWEWFVAGILGLRNDGLSS